MKTISVKEMDPEELADLIDHRLAIRIDDAIGRLFNFKLNHSETTGDEYLTRKETARLLRISSTTLYERTKDGMFRAYKSGKRILYKKAEILDTLEVMPNSKP